MQFQSFKEIQFVKAKKAEPSSKYLMICLHGRGDTLLGVRKLRHRLKLDHWNYLFMNAPDNWTTESGFEGFSWYPRMPHVEEGIERSLKMLRLLLMELEVQGFPRENILLYGFSQGCVMSLELALRSPRPFFGVIGSSGTIFRAQDLIDQLKEQAMRTPILMIHGISDEMLEIARVRSKAQQLQEFLPNFEFLEVDKKHNMAEFEYPIIREKVLEWEEDHELVAS